MDEIGPTCPSNPDFYAVVRIADEEFNTKKPDGHVEFPNSVDIDTPNWELFKPLEGAPATVAITIDLWDQDGLGDGAPPDDHIDIEGDGNSKTIELTIDMAACATPAGTNGVSGDVSGNCNATLSSSGQGDDRADIRFKIVVEAPPSEGDLRIRCMHGPVWPQPGEDSTITATALDANLMARSTGTLEVWVDNRNNARQTCSVAAGSNTCSSTRVADASQTYNYGCRYVDGAVTVWSGWRTVQIGNPSSGKAIPVVQTGPRDRRIDIVFVADDDSYTSGTDSAFLGDVSSVIANGYYAEDLFLSNQHNVNFWIAPDRGDALGYQESFPPHCELTGPSNWDKDYTFADVGAVLHTDTLRDCAMGNIRLFSSEPTSLRTIIHETGHTPFGLADEYCNPKCDGGYFEPESFPNLYYEKEDCRADAGDLGVNPDLCRGFRGKHTPLDWLAEEDWFTSDVEKDHLMDDDGVPRPGDRRRIVVIFDRCRQAKCHPQ